MWDVDDVNTGVYGLWNGVLAHKPTQTDIISRSPTICSFKITDLSFRYASPHLWNKLPDSFRQPRQSCLDSPPHSLVSSSL